MGHRPVDGHAAGPRAQPLEQAIAQRCQPRAFLRHPALVEQARVPQPDNARHVQGARPASALLASSDDEGRKVGMTTHVQRPAALGTVHLVARERQKIDPVGLTSSIRSSRYVTRMSPRAATR